MLVRFFRLLGSVAVRFPMLYRVMLLWMPSPMRLLSWKTFERQLLIYKLPAGTVALANDLAVAENVLADRDGKFPKSTHLEAMLRPLIGQGVFGQPGGDAVRERRKTYLKVLAKVSDAEVENVARSLTKSYMKAWGQSGGRVLVPREMSRLTIDIVTKVIFDDCFTEEESSKFVDLFFEYHKRCNPSLVFCTSGDSESELRFLRCVELDTIGQEMRSMLWRRFVAPVVEEISFSRKTSLFVSALLEEVGELPEEELATVLLDEISVMVLAGHETSASVLSWLFWEISGNPSLVSGLRSSDKDSPAFSKELESLIQEGLRLYPPIAFYLRDVKEDTEFRGKNLPSGSSIAISPWTIHRHKGVWEQAAKFCPARWLVSTGKSEYSKLRFQPFGYGARFCPGKYFAEAELRAILSEVVMVMNIERIEGREPVPLGNLTSRPDYDFCLKFSCRT